MDCSLPGFSVHGTLQARILEWVAISFFRGSSRPRDQTQVSCIAGRCFNLWATREASLKGAGKFYECIAAYHESKTWDFPQIPILSGNLIPINFSQDTLSKTTSSFIPSFICYHSPWEMTNYFPDELSLAPGNALFFPPQFIYLFLWPHHAACGTLVPWPGIEPTLPAVEVQSLNHWTTRDVPIWCSIRSSPCFSFKASSYEVNAGLPAQNRTVFNPDPSWVIYCVNTHKLFFTALG